ncbi:MAG: hypothetical protein Q9220_004818 [cf. Caloplaca sp. 1 TL-2023]
MPSPQIKYLTPRQLASLLLPSSPSSSSKTPTPPPKEPPSTNASPQLPTPITTPSPVSPSDIAIIDVRTHDHIGGHIRSSLHCPSDTLPTYLPTLVRKLQAKKMVVWHCALSQVRGPSAARDYVEVRERMLGKGVGEEVENGGAGEEGGKKGEREGEQEVYVLEGGFTAWQAVFGEDERLTEGWVRDIWRDGEEE